MGINLFTWTIITHSIGKKLSIHFTILLKEKGMNLLTADALKNLYIHYFCISHSKWKCQIQFALKNTLNLFLFVYLVITLQRELIAVVFNLGKAIFYHHLNHMVGAKLKYVMKKC